MLHPTHHPLFSFPCFPFSSTPHSLSSSSSSSSYSSQSTATISQVENEMECLMKGGFLPEICPSNAAGAGVISVSGEDLFVDQLLNLDNDNTNPEEEKYDNNGVLVAVKEEENEPTKSEKDSAFLSPPPPHPLETDRNRDDFGSVLSLPAEEADLEWLSQFVEESFSTFSTPFPTGFKPFSGKPDSKPGPGSEAPKAHCFTPPPALSKARRSKRARTGCRVWSAGLAEPASSSSSSTTTTTTSSSSPSSPNPDLAPAKKQRKRETGSGGGSPPRRCSHCGVQKTPQWRAGPYGPKTLCNACGVRYKSGRLLPEYRPACSPTFSSELHSNNHRKVLEMRRKKEAGQPDSSLPHPVPSFG